MTLTAAARPARARPALDQGRGAGELWFDVDAQAEGGIGATETYGGTQLTVFAAPKMPGRQAAFAIVDGKVALVGDLDSVKAAIDTKGASRSRRAKPSSAAQASVTGDSLGFMFVDLKAHRRCDGQARRLDQGRGRFRSVAQ